MARPKKLEDLSDEDRKGELVALIDLIAIKKDVTFTLVAAAIESFSTIGFQRYITEDRNGVFRVYLYASKRIQESNLKDAQEDWDRKKAVYDLVKRGQSIGYSQKQEILRFISEEGLENPWPA